MPYNFVFTPVVYEDKKLFEEVYDSCDLYKESLASETTFESIYCWSAGENALKCVIDEGIIVLYNFPDGSSVLYPPLVRKREYFLPVVIRMAEYFHLNNKDVFIERLTKEMADLTLDWDCERCRTIAVRGDFEYLYDPQDLIKLEGGDYKSKRNFIHGFMTDYDYEFLTYNPSMKNEVLGLVDFCGKDPTSHSFNLERMAIERALDELERLNMFCDVIKVDGNIIAFSIGFINKANVGICMFEKADTAFRGSYAVINNFVASKRFSECRYINRQEDLGIEGLRKAKMSYKPVAFSEKFIITDRPETLITE